LVIVFLIAFTGLVYADRNVPAEPEIQGLATSTGMNVQGTITETDSGAWSINANGIPLSGDDPLLASYPGWATDNYWLSYSGFLADWHNWKAATEPYPVSYGPTLTLQDMLNYIVKNNWGGGGADANNLLTWLQNQGSQLTPPLESGEVQYTTGYNDQIVAVSGQSLFAKSVAVSTGNKIADQSNIKADTSLQYVTIDTGRATRTEDLLLDGASNSSDNAAGAILCPFVTSVSPVIPAYCNIEQAGSSIDTTLISVVTHADDRFIGTDSTFPVALNYNINAEGITAGTSSSPMIGSVSAYLKVHVQEARNDSTNLFIFPIDPSLTTTNTPQKSEDLVYSETSTASGLINHFGKSMSYQSGMNLI